MSDSSSSSKVQIALCTGTNCVGKSNCCPFTYVPTIGVLCVNAIKIGDVANVGYSETKIKNGTSYTRFFNTTNNLNLYIQTINNETACPSDVYNILCEYSFILWDRFPTYGLIGNHSILHGCRIKNDFDEDAFAFMDSKGCQFEFTGSSGLTNVKLCIFC